ncbi:hypothetical protein CEXT_85941 [Caerostris extrusa]|uniref:Uncharacterized protein n=1 Tax=Caerostris extrusa TaxID=172846 RepID=A0AAV4Y570_CAEEX|nr:hypothetical protein CEXT_85941 [Caerostris extrusa]
MSIAVEIAADHITVLIIKTEGYITRAGISRLSAQLNCEEWCMTCNRRNQIAGMAVFDQLPSVIQIRSS